MPEVVSSVNKYHIMKSKAILLPAYQGNIIRALRSLEMKEIEIKPPAHDEVLLESQQRHKS
jgi:hypothetical protein